MPTGYKLRRALAACSIPSALGELSEDRQIEEAGQCAHTAGQCKEFELETPNNPIITENESYVLPISIGQELESLLAKKEEEYSRLAGLAFELSESLDELEEQHLRRIAESLGSMIDEKGFALWQQSKAGVGLTYDAYSEWGRTKAE
jgi:hypothetical protein